MRETGAASVGLDMRAVDPALFPNVVAALRRAGIDPTRELVPVAPAAHYMMGGIATDLDRARDRPRPLRGRRVRLHRAARREPARVELAQRVLRVRPPRRARRAWPSRRRAPRRASRRAGTAAPAARRGEPRRAVARRRDRARRRGAAHACSTTRTRSSRLVAACALAREESRGAHLRRDFPAARARARRAPHRRPRCGRPGARALGLIPYAAGRRTSTFVRR